MNIAEELRAQSNQHPLDADLEMFNVAATRIQELESAICNIQALAECGEDSYYSAQNCCAAILSITYKA